MSQRCTLFISDLHLDAGRPHIIQVFRDFLQNQARTCEALYILGDLFEYWIGDDQPLGELAPVVEDLRNLSDAGTPIYFIAGNRDFLVGATLAQTAGLSLLPDQCVISVYGESTLIMHGDTLCSDDLEYQKLRSMLRDPEWQREFLALPLDARIQQALSLRETSQDKVSNKAADIMDVNAEAVAQTMRAQGVHTLIHGHTHRPGIHHFTLDQQPATRIVLGDWYQRGSVLRVTEEGAQLEKLG